MTTVYETYGKAPLASSDASAIERSEALQVCAGGEPAKTSAFASRAARSSILNGGGK